MTEEEISTTCYPDEDDLTTIVVNETGIQRYKMTVQYDGSAYSGWQRQGKYVSKTSGAVDGADGMCNPRTVQEVLEDALSNFVRAMIVGKSVKSTTTANGTIIMEEEQDDNRCHVPLFGSSRTDAGVHAICTTAHFDLMSCQVRKNVMPDGDKVMKSLNSYLCQEKISVTSVVKVSQSYHARHAARKRIYNYKIVIVPDTHVNSRFPLLENKVWFLNLNEFVRKNTSGGETRKRVLQQSAVLSLDVEKMKHAANIMQGTHDFSAFCSPGDPQRNRDMAINHVRTIESIRIEYHDASGSNNSQPNPLTFFMSPVFDTVSITIEGPSFLYHQCRYIVCMLVSVGMNLVSLDELRLLFETKEMPRGKRRMAPPHGLYLVNVLEKE